MIDYVLMSKNLYFIMVLIVNLKYFNCVEMVCFLVLKLYEVS